MAVRLAAMAWPVATCLAGRYSPEGLLPPLQANSKVLLIEYQQGWHQLIRNFMRCEMSQLRLKQSR